MQLAHSLASPQFWTNPDRQNALCHLGPFRLGYPLPCTLDGNPHVQTSRQLGRGVPNFGLKSPYTNISGQLGWCVHNFERKSPYISIKPVRLGYPLLWEKKKPVNKHVMPVWLESPKLLTKIPVPKHNTPVRLGCLLLWEKKKPRVQTCHASLAGESTTLDENSSTKT